MMDPYLWIKENELILPGVTGEHVFLHVRDTHLSVRDGESTPEEAAEARSWEEKWMVGKENFARKFREPFGDAQRISTVEGFEKILRYAADSGAEALILTGDNLEKPHPAGARKLRALLGDFPIPVLTVPGNHEDASLPGVWEPGVRVLDFGAFRLVGVDDRLGTVEAEDLDRLGVLGEEGIPMIVCCHIPAAARGNRERMREYGP